jgi:D-beta-D-heptose 7-phosphate kinase/D-beta-D-heptose 1-phosphate adenosyltransferase
LGYQDKIWELDKALELVREVKKLGRRIVFTNGCFDLIHKGHISYLEKSRLLGDFLVVGLNSDASVKRLKGASRPVKDLESRKAVLAGLAAVDMVVVFEEDTPENLIAQLMPDVLVKGGDYKKEEIVGADLVMQNGGRVEIIDFVEGYSSSAIIQKLESE